MLAEAGVGMRDRASGDAARMGSALLCRGRSTWPTTEHLARDVPERSEDEARPVTGAVHAGSSRRDSFAGAAGGRAGLRPVAGTYGLATSKDWGNPAMSRSRAGDCPVRIRVSHPFGRRGGLHVVRQTEGRIEHGEVKGVNALNLNRAPKLDKVVRSADPSQSRRRQHVRHRQDEATGTHRGVKQHRAVH